LKLVECVPNFSEGRRKEVIEAIVSEARTRRVKVLDIESDVDHNRSVLTFVGDPENVKDAAMAVSAKAIELIDLNNHQGQHPRMGAVDVVPFVPVSDITLQECVRLAKEFAADYAEQFKIPVYLYEAAATREDRRNLADVRRGEFEGLRNEIGQNPDKKPDFGPNRIHPTAGATAIGARQILIAYNINLNTDNLDVARRIARQVRGKDGGLSAVKALGFELKDRGIVQISMNMVDYKASQLYKTFELVRTLAEQNGVQVLESEIVGLVPTEALTDSAEFYLRLRNFSKDQILERKLAESKSTSLVDMGLGAFAAEVASDKPVPGGGSVSAYSASLAASLVSMVARLTLKRPEYEKDWPIVNEVLSESDNLQRHLLALVDRDAESFSELMKAYRLPKKTELEKQTRAAEIESKLMKASTVPLETAEAAGLVLAIAKKLALCANLNALSDLQTAISLSQAGLAGAAANVAINIPGVKNSKFREETQHKLASIETRAEEDRKETVQTLGLRSKAS